MIIAYTALLYGLEYLEYAIRSVVDYVDEYHIIYSPVGAHGARSDMPCPETRGELLYVARKGAGNKLRWHDAGPFPHEGAQRDSIHILAPGADIVLVVDYDEIWQPGLPERAIAAATAGHTRRYLVPMRHYWRSFRRLIQDDGDYPVRVINTHHADGTARIVSDGLAINHMGYAISPVMMAYKWTVHGHKNQVRRDVNWFADKYLNPDAKTDLHPCAKPIWNLEPTPPDTWGYMPPFMRAHPFANMETIE